MFVLILLIFAVLHQRLYNIQPPKGPTLHGIAHFEP